jgi:branched-chain amino acid transport system permease protein
MNVLQTLIDGLALGALYALVAIGIALVFGVMRLINFAQGELITAGAYSLWLTRHLPLAASIVICFLVCIVLALLMQGIAFRPLRNAPPATTLVATFAVAFALEALWLVAFSPTGRTVVQLAALNGLVTHGTIQLRWVTIAEIGAGAVLLIGTAVILNRTNIGLQMRAAATDLRAARLLGVRADRMIAVAFVLAGVMAAVVALLLTVQDPLVSPTFGLNATILALVGAVLGGIDRLTTATAGGFAIGFITGVLGDVLPSSQEVFLTAFTFLIVLIALLIRPEGLFAPLGRGRVERV